MPVNQPVDTTIPPINTGSPTGVTEPSRQNIPNGASGLQRPERYF